MGEARTRPGRERMRYEQVVRANLWFWHRALSADDPNWDVINDWTYCQDSLKIRRWKAAQPQESSDAGDPDEEPLCCDKCQYGEDDELLEKQCDQCLGKSKPQHT